MIQLLLQTLPRTEKGEEMPWFLCFSPVLQFHCLHRPWGIKLAGVTAPASQRRAGKGCESKRQVLGLEEEGENQMSARRSRREEEMMLVDGRTLHWCGGDRANPVRVGKRADWGEGEFWAECSR